MLELIIGPMGSCKTSLLFEKIGECLQRKMKCLYINYVNDIREVSQNLSGITTHSLNPVKLNENITCLHVDKLENVNIEEYEAIAIDEAHFYPDLYQFVNKWTNDKLLYVAGLNADSNMKPIGQIHLLISIADDIIHRKAICAKCQNMNKNASFTARICEDKSQFHVGGFSDYIPVCRFHFF